MHTIYGCPNLSKSLKVFRENFGTVRQKQSRESWYPYYPKNFDTRIFLKHRTVRPRWFLAMWEKKIRKNRDTLVSKKISIPEQFCNTEGFAHDDFRRFETKKINKIVTPYSPKLFDTRTFLRHKGPLRNVSVLWDKKDQQNRDTAIVQNNFDSRTFLKHRRVRPRCLFAIWDKKFPTE